MRKAQFELIGLAVIVIIIAFGIFLLLAFSLQEKEDLTEQFVEDQFSQNILDALMKTSLEGCDGTMADLLAWTLDADFPSNALPGSDCEQPSDLSIPPTVLVTQLDAVIGTYMNRPYRFIVREYSAVEEVCSSPSIRTCDSKGFTSTYDVPDPSTAVWCDPDQIGQRSARAGRQWISLYPEGKAEVILWICG